MDPRKTSETTPSVQTTHADKPSSEQRSETDQRPRCGAFFEGDGVRFRAWSPEHRELSLTLYADDGTTELRRLPLTATEGGFFEAVIPRAAAPARVLYRMTVDGQGPFPDPFSRAQPFSVHGPSEVVSHAFAWTDEGFTGVLREDLVLYEVHVGAATPEGTFEALIPRLDDLKRLGVTMIELMPVASFPGARNWGYDGVSLFAPAAVYGGPEGLKRLIDAAHARGLGVMLDVVYNHLGPDGNYLRVFSDRYYTERHHTPWGAGLNLDGEGTEPVRELLLENAAMWVRDYHVDGLRLDATHAIQDDRSPHILREIGERARAAGPGRSVLVIAEDERNDARLVLPASEGGFGLDGVWADDFHHQARRAFAGDHDGYYADYTGSALDIVATLNAGWFYEGQLSQHQGKPRGTKAGKLPPSALVHCIQNHDQIGNRALGDRLSAGVSPSAYRAMSALLLLSPYTPLLFMGQEWGASAPFQFFTDHNAELGRLVTEGRRREFAHFTAFRGTEVPDPQAEATFRRSKLDWAEREAPEHRGVLAFYEALLRLRASHPVFRSRQRGAFSARLLGERAVSLTIGQGASGLTVIVNLGGSIAYEVSGAQRARLASDEPQFGGASPLEALFDGRVARLEGPAALVLEATGA